MHILNLQDGSPYHPLPSNAIMWELPYLACFVSGVEVAMTDSRVMMFGSYLNGDWQIVVWDWKTGNLVRLLWFDKP